MGDNDLKLNPGTVPNTGGVTAPTPDAAPAESTTKPTEAQRGAIEGEIYMIPNVSNYALGEFKFTDGMLILTDAEKIKEFEAAWKKQLTLTPGYAMRIRKVNAETADHGAMKQALLKTAISGAEDSERQARQLNPALG